MKKLNKHERIRIAAAGILLLSIISMIAIIPGILNDVSHPNPKLPINKGIIPAILIHLFIFISYLIIIGLNWLDGKKRKALKITLGVLLIIFGLIYLDGAIAFSNNENIIYVPYLMFTSVFCNLIASVLIFKSMK